MASDNRKLMARVPIIPDDFANKDQHKTNELVMDYSTNDIYAKKEDGYVNITGKIKDEIKQIQDGSMVIHIVTESTLPPIKDRKENHWYYVVTRSEDANKGSSISTVSYVYYGLIDTYSTDKNYLLIAQNSIDGPAVVKIRLVDGYVPCFYVPITMSASFIDATTKEEIEYTVEDRVYALNNELGTFISYDVYILKLTEPKEYFIDVNISGSDYFVISFDSNYDVPGIVLPDSIGVHDGSAIGDALPEEPSKSDPRYTFQGWSTSNIAAQIIDKTYKPESNMTLYAFYEYNSDPNVYTYYSTYYSTTVDEEGNHKVIGSYCSTGSKDELITPKTIPGYKTPDAQTLDVDEKQFSFYYEPIVYNITYNLNGGSIDKDAKTTFTVEDTYTPPTPTYKNHYFAGWTPASIGLNTTSDVTFEAAWNDYAILLSGSKINSRISSLCGLDTIYSIQIATALPSEAEQVEVIDISSTDSPIYAWESEGILMIYCARDELWTNDDMSGAFENMTLLRDISALSSFSTNTGMDISNLFKGCTVLSDVNAVENWAIGIFSDFTGAFDGTTALETGRTPSWYKWDVTINYVSTSGKVIETATKTCIPGATIYAKVINAYSIVTKSVVITSPDVEYTFEYSPVSYNIYYELSEGIIEGQKTTYTIEDESYIPPSPVKEGYNFVGWSPEQITQGDYGNVTFIANYSAK